VALTKDERITRRPNEQEALAASTLRVFAIGNQHLTGPQMAQYYVTTSIASCGAAGSPGRSSMLSIGTRSHGAGRSLEFRFS
jgi:hypothetical protein